MTAAAYRAGDQARRNMIAKVKIAQKELGLDEVAYRAMLLRLTNQNSAALCSVAQLGVVLDELKAKGWVPKVVTGGKTGRPAKPARADHPAAGKARALWISLYQLGVVHDRRESVLEAFAKRQLKVERLQWADQGQVYKLIEALKAMAQRHGWSQDGSLDEIKARLAELLRRKAEEDGG